MKQLFTLVIVFLGIHYSAADINHVADLRVGTITLLDGYTNKTGYGIDSTPGRITRADGNFVINYDIGFMAGYHISPAHKTDYSWYREQIINGQRPAWVFLKKRTVNTWWSPFTRLQQKQRESPPTSVQRLLIKMKLLTHC